MKALIIGNGEPPSRVLFDVLMASAPDLVLCADGGTDVARAFGVEPDAIVGDLDSASTEALQQVDGGRQVRIDADNTGTDLNKTLRHALSLGVEEAVLVGVTGRRVDHTLWNLSLLKTFGARLRLSVADDHQRIWLLRPGQMAVLRGAAGRLVSLSPLDGPARGISTEGLRWPLAHEDLTPGERDGISNEVLAPHAVVRLQGPGDLLLVVQQSAKDHVDVDVRALI